MTIPDGKALRAAVAHAIEKLHSQDVHLLQIDASERSLVFRFALYMQEFLKPYQAGLDGIIVDCEYNRVGQSANNVKRLLNSFGARGRGVIPDIIVHQRGNNNICLVIEVKVAGRRGSGGEIDRRKLQGYKCELGYHHSLFLTLNSKLDTSLDLFCEVIEWDTTRILYSDLAQ